MSKINIWSGEDGFFATLKDGKELTKEIDTITLQLVESVVSELKMASYDELMDWLDTCTLNELIMFVDYFIDDHRLFEVTKIEIMRR
jgi:hypothetical protein